MKPGTRSVYVTDAQGHKQEVGSLRVSYAKLDIPNADRLRDISHVYVDPKYRKKGHAKELLRQVCQEADRLSIILALQPKPYADGVMSEDDLGFLYRRFGWIEIHGNPPVMVRQCRSGRAQS